MKSEPKCKLCSKKFMDDIHQAWLNNPEKHRYEE